MRDGELKSIDVPQADSLPTIREVIEAVSSGATTVRQVAMLTRFSERHVRYRMQSARILGFLGDDSTMTSQGQELLSTNAGTCTEMEVFERAILAASVVRSVVPDIFTSNLLDRDAIASKLQKHFGLSEATALRRVRVLASWKRQIESRKREFVGHQ